jgi:hypothetical protein
MCTRSQWPPAHRTPAAVRPSGDGSASRTAAPRVRRVSRPVRVSHANRSGRTTSSAVNSSRDTSTRRPSAKSAARGAVGRSPRAARPLACAGAGTWRTAATSSGRAGGSRARAARLGAFGGGVGRGRRDPRAPPLSREGAPGPPEEFDRPSAPVGRQPPVARGVREPLDQRSLDASRRVEPRAQGERVGRGLRREAVVERGRPPRRRRRRRRRRRGGSRAPRRGATRR